MMAQQTAPVLVVRNGNWGATSLKGVHGVLASAAGVLLDGFGAAPEAPIHVAPWRQAPRVFGRHRPYQMRISAPCGATAHD